MRLEYDCQIASDDVALLGSVKGAAASSRGGNGARGKGQPGVLRRRSSLQSSVTVSYESLQVARLYQCHVLRLDAVGACLEACFLV